jgi:hypothetical protein
MAKPLLKRVDLSRAKFNQCVTPVEQALLAARYNRQGDWANRSKLSATLIFTRIFWEQYIEICAKPLTFTPLLTHFPLKSVVSLLRSPSV